MKLFYALMVAVAVWHALDIAYRSCLSQKGRPTPGTVSAYTSSR